MIIIYEDGECLHRMEMTVSSEEMVTGCCGQQLLTVFVLLMIIECVISLKLLELRVPAHVALGTRAALSCRWALGPADMLYSVKWYKDGKEFFRHVPRDHEPLTKFLLPGVDVEESDSSGSSLVLSAAVSDSGGRYRCEVSGEGPLFNTVSEHADMDVVVLPEHGPVLSGLRSRYHLGDRVQVNCTSGRSRPANRLSWYINGEPAPTTALRPLIHQTYGDLLETTTLLLDFTLTEQHFKRNGLKVKCLATLATLYWSSNEESARLENEKVLEKQAPILETDTRSHRVHSNLAILFTSSSTSIISMFLVARYCIRLG